MVRTESGGDGSPNNYCLIAKVLGQCSVVSSCALHLGRMRSINMSSWLAKALGSAIWRDRRRMIREASRSMKLADYENFSVYTFFVQPLEGCGPFSDLCAGLSSAQTSYGSNHKLFGHAQR